MTIEFSLNGEPISVEDLDGGARLSTVLREHCGARDVKVGCEAGDCGACTVLVDGDAYNACIVAAAQVHGRHVETADGLFRRGDADARRVADAFQSHGAVQCGICFPGLLTSLVALKRGDATPDETAVSDALGGVLCRCSGYRKLLAAAVASCAPETDSPTPAPVAPGVVGDAVARVDGMPRITGAEAFGDDVAPAGALLLRLVRSPHAHAAFAFGDVSAWITAHPGVEAVLRADDVPGINRFGVIPGFEDQPVFAETQARFRGEAIAAVVGDHTAVSALDLSTFPVSFEPLVASASMSEARGAHADALHGHANDNVMCRGRVAKGDTDAALARADVVKSGVFETGFVEHAYIEPEAGYAVSEGDRVAVFGCTQAPVMDQEALARILDLDKTQVRVVPTSTGGGFGSKLDLSFQPYVALAAVRLKRAVRVCYTRQESMQSTTKRHPSRMAVRIGATRDGRLCGFDFDGEFNTGAYASWGPTVANRVPVHASGPYAIDDYRAATAGIYTHNPPAGAFRGFGVPQAAIAQELLFDELADELGLDPLAFRRQNALRDGVPTATGQCFQTGVGIVACLDALAPHWSALNAEADTLNRESAGRFRHGVGLAAGWYGCGNTSLPNPSTMKSALCQDGRVVLHQGAVDIGQGANTVIAQIFATALGCDLRAVGLEGGDTDITPDGGKTSASRQTFVSGNAARLSGEALRADILVALGAPEGATLEFGDTLIGARLGDDSWPFNPAAFSPDNAGYVLCTEQTYDPPTSPLDENGQGEPYAQFGYAAHVIALTVDTALGTVNLDRIVAAHDVGKAINPMLVEGQVHGGVAQGVGMALMESYLPGVSEDLHSYLIPTVGDLPPIESEIVEVPDAHGPYGAKGLGEHVLIPTTPAILNAIRRATGATLRSIPATPESILDALRRDTRSKE